MYSPGTHGEQACARRVACLRLCGFAPADYSDIQLRKNSGADAESIRPFASKHRGRQGLHGVFRKLLISG